MTDEQTTTNPTNPPTRWRRSVYRWMIWNNLYRFWFDLRVEGTENIPKNGPVIIMGNHVSAVDPVIMISFFPGRDIVPLAKLESFHNRGLRLFVTNWEAIPVNRGEADISAFKEAIKQVRAGYIVMFYAEGTRSKTGMIRGKEGSVFLALKTDATIVPVGIWGGRDWPKSWWKAGKRVPINIRFGKPFRFNHEGRKLPRDNFQEMTDEAMYRIAALIPPEWRGVYRDIGQATTQFIDTNISWEPSEVQIPAHVSTTIPPFKESNEELLYVPSG